MCLHASEGEFMPRCVCMCVCVIWHVVCLQLPMHHHAILPSNPLYSSCPPPSSRHPHHHTPRTHTTLTRYTSQTPTRQWPATTTQQLAATQPAARPRRQSRCASLACVGPREAPVAPHVALGGNVTGWPCITKPWDCYVRSGQWLWLGCVGVAPLACAGTTARGPRGGACVGA